MNESVETKPGRQVIYRKNPNTGHKYPVGTATSGHNDVPKLLPDGTPLLTEEENIRRQSGTGSHAAHVAQANEEREEKLREEGSI
jgi:hypothetical protein